MQILVKVGQSSMQFDTSGCLRLLGPPLVKVAYRHIPAVERIKLKTLAMRRQMHYDTLINQAT